MIDIQKQIDYWRNGSQEDWEVAGKAKAELKEAEKMLKWLKNQF